ncbi:MAG: hypothetical protein HY815_14270 [Candidatus Riflebacteria bacterium]|nr:hypothetical protein [Candidatus Riflebacteria bacterium]
MTPRALDPINVVLCCALLAVLGHSGARRRPVGVAIQAVGRIGGGAPEIELLPCPIVPGPSSSTPRPGPDRASGP